MHSTGSRGSLYEKIDGLDEARTVADLVARLKPILNELAYYAITGDGAVMEAREEWHGEFADRLYAAAGAEYTAAAAGQSSAIPAPRAAARAPARTPDKRAKPKQPARADGEGDDDAAARPLPTNGRSRGPVAPPGNRPRAEHLPPSLRAIMEGTHPSFKEDDDH